jgi:hypothetical protein
MEKKYRYLMNHEVFGSETQKPQYRATANENECDEYKKNYEDWHTSLVKLECSESELDKIIDYKNSLFDYTVGNEIVDITKRTTVKELNIPERGGKFTILYKVYFKEVECESNEAIEFEKQLAAKEKELSELRNNAYELLKIAKHYIKNHDYHVIVKANELLTNPVDPK